MSDDGKRDTADSTATLQGDENQSNGDNFDLGKTLELAQKHGHKLLTETQLANRLAREQKKIDDALESANKLSRQNEALAKKLAEYEDKGKSVDQKQLEEMERVAKQRDAYQSQLADSNATIQRLVSQQRQADLDRKLAGVFAVSGPEPVNVEQAVLLARHEVRSLSIDDRGVVIHTDPVTEIETKGDAAIKLVSAWWEKQTHMHRATAAGPPITSGSSGDGTHERPWRELSDYERFERRKGQ